MRSLLKPGGSTPARPKRSTPVRSGSRGASMLRKLEALDLEVDSITQTGHSRWMIPYADLLTLLLGLFMVLFSLSKVDNETLKIYSEQLQNSLQQQNTLLITAQSLNSENNLPISQTGSPMSDDDTSIHPEDMLLEDMIAQDLKIQSGISVSREERGVVISMEENILFPLGSADLTSNAKTTLDQLAISLQEVSRPIRVEGHTDNTPIATAKYPSNWELSTARATNILKYLISKHHFKPDQLSATGYGEYHPIAENSSIEGKQKNRRVDIVILNRLGAQQEPGSAQVAKPQVTKGLSGPQNIQTSRTKPTQNALSSTTQETQGRARG